MSIRLASGQQSLLYRLSARWNALRGARRWTMDVTHWRALALLIAAVWLCWNLFRGVVLAVAPSGEPAAVAAGQAAGSDGASLRSRPVDIDTLVGWQLFGEPGAADTTSSPAAVEAVNTALDVTLQGVIVASEETQASAIIHVRGESRRYLIGDTLPVGNNVTLAGVQTDRVVLDNNGRREAVWLYNPAAAQRRSVRPRTTAAPALPQEAATRPAAAAGDLAGMVRMSVVREDGRQVGYRLHPGRNPEQFERLGFQPGDIVTAIDGAPLDDPQRALELYNNMETAQSATFSIQRGDQELTLVVSLDDQ